MKPLCFFAPLLSVLFLAACAPVQPVAVGSAKTQAAAVEPKVIVGTVRGVLRQIGNAPHIELVVTGSSDAFGMGDYHLSGLKSDEVAKLPLGPITIKGKLRKHAMRLAGSSGKSLTRLDVEVLEYKR